MRASLTFTLPGIRVFHKLLIKCVIYTVPDFSDQRLRTAIVFLRLLCGFSDANMTEATVHRVAAEYFCVRSTLKCILRPAIATAMLRYMIPA